MPLKLATAAAVVMALLRPAYADTRIGVRAGSSELELLPSLVLGTPTRSTIDRATLALRLTAERTHATLKLSLSNNQATARDVAMTIDVPSGARVTGLAYSMAGELSVATPMAMFTARSRYFETIERDIDPALLEHTESMRRHDRLTLHVYPLTKTTPAEVVIEMDLPPGPVLELDPDRQTIKRVDIDIDGKVAIWSEFKTARAITLPAPTAHASWITEDPTLRHVDAFTSLYAAEPPNAKPLGLAPPRIPSMIISCSFGTAHHSVSVDKKTIRRTIKQHLDQITYCWAREAQRDPSIEGKVDLHFSILASGKTDEVSVDGPLASDTVKACIAAQAASWTFHESDGTTRVNYPFTFHLNR